MPLCSLCTTTVFYDATLEVAKDIIRLAVGQHSMIGFRDRNELLLFLNQCRDIQEFLLATPEGEEDE